MVREGAGANGSYALRDPEISYDGHFDPENGGLRQENTFFWDISD